MTAATKDSGGSLDALLTEWGGIVREFRKRDPNNRLWWGKITTSGRYWTVVLWPDGLVYAGSPGIAEGEGESLSDALRQAVAMGEAFLQGGRP